MRRAAALLIALLGPVLAGCGGGTDSSPTGDALLGSGSALRPFVTAAAADAPGFARGRAFRPPALPARSDCTAETLPRTGTHVELFAARRIVVLAPGIGVGGARLDDGRVAAARCSQPARTMDSSGVVEVADGARVTLGALFDSWGQPLSRTRLAGFRGSVRAEVDGHRVAGDPRAIVLAPHAQIVLAVGPRVPVHAGYVFREGL